MHARGWFVVLSVTTLACSSGGGGSSGGTGLPSGTACVRVNNGEEICLSSGVAANRDTDGSTIHMSVEHWTNVDCFSRPANEFVLNVNIPDGLPFPYQANRRPGDANFGTATCAWTALNFEGDLVSGTIYQAGTNGSSHLEGDVTDSYRDGNAAVLCSSTCTGAKCDCPDTASLSARFRFNVPL